MAAGLSSRKVHGGSSSDTANRCKFPAIHATVDCSTSAGSCRPACLFLKRIIAHSSIPSRLRAAMETSDKRPFVRAVAPPNPGCPESVTSARTRMSRRPARGTRSPVFVIIVFFIISIPVLQGEVECRRGAEQPRSCVAAHVNIPLLPLSDPLVHSPAPQPKKQIPPRNASKHFQLMALIPGLDQRACTRRHNQRSSIWQESPVASALKKSPHLIRPQHRRHAAVDGCQER